MITINTDLIMEEDMTFDEDLDCENLNCRDLKIYENLNCKDLSFYATAITYNSFKCRTWKAGRENYIIKCLDGEIIGGKKK